MPRLMSMAQIKQEKLARGNTWIWEEIKAGRFPPPVKMNESSSSRHLWDETEVDRAVGAYLAAARAREDALLPPRTGRVYKALQARGQDSKASRVEQQRPIANTLGVSEQSS